MGAVLIYDHLTDPCRTPSGRIDARLPHAWNYIRDIRARVHEMLNGANDELRSAAMMTVSELIENAVKYGEAVPGAPEIIVSCCSADGEVRITVSNGSTDADCLRKLRARVEQIATSSDKEALYMARLEEMLAEPSQSGSLGLYRIAFEGRFELHVASARNIVTVSASRRCP